MVYKYAGQLLANGLGKHNGSNRRVDAAGQSTENLAGTEFFHAGP